MGTSYYYVNFTKKQYFDPWKGLGLSKMIEYIVNPQAGAILILLLSDRWYSDKVGIVDEDDLPKNYRNITLSATKLIKKYRF